MTTATTIKERPILFSAPMVRALLDGRKTQTRRVVKQLMRDEGRAFIFRDGRVWASMLPSELAPLDENPPRSVFGGEVIFDGNGQCFTPVVVGKGPKGEGNRLECPYGQPGDRLWVKENWWAVELTGCGIGKPFLVFDDEIVGKEPMPAVERPLVHVRRYGRKSPIHMPKKYARIFLEIIDVRVERLNEINEADAEAEGPTPKWFGDFGVEKWTSAYRNLWIDINGHGSWEVNPWVWALTFRRVG